jgi:hypothetical protein
MSGARVFERLAETFGKRLRNDCPYLLEEPLTISCLNVDQAIGNPVPFTDFALQRGEERLVEAAFRGAKGQAFTSSPSSWQGTVADLLDLPPENDRNRAFFTAGVNAVGRHLGWGEKTVHCRDASPKRCGETMGKHLAGELGPGERVALVGYQPAILGGLAAALGSGRVCVLDLNPENIGRTVSGVTVLDGEKDLPAAASRSDLALATGSALTNGTIDSILEAFGGKRVVFFGTTIAVPAALLGFERLCFESE